MKLISPAGLTFVCGETHIYFIAREEPNKDNFFKTDLDTVTPISQTEFNHFKFGNCTRAVSSSYGDCIKLENGEYLTCVFYDSKIYRHDRDGNKIKEYGLGQFKNGFDTIYSITLDKNGKLWIAQPTSHYIGQFDIETEKELFRISGEPDEPGILSYPEHIIAIENYVYISDMGHKRICKVNIETKELTDHLKFEETAWEYGIFKNKEIVRLASGIYEL